MQFRTIQLAEDAICIGPTRLLPQGRPVAELTLEVPDHMLPLYHQGVLQSRLHIYDQFGLRFWAQEGLVGECSWYWKPESGNVFAAHTFSGTLAYRGRVVLLPAASTLLANGQLPGFVSDDDALRWGMVAYATQLPQLRYYAIVTKTMDTTAASSELGNKMRGRFASPPGPLSEKERGSHPVNLLINSSD